MCVGHSKWLEVSSQLSGGQVVPSTMWVPGTELRSSSLPANTFFCWVTSQAQDWQLWLRAEDKSERIPTLCPHTVSFKALERQVCLYKYGFHVWTWIHPFPIICINKMLTCSVMGLTGSRQTLEMSLVNPGTQWPGFTLARSSCPSALS